MRPYLSVLPFFTLIVFPEIAVARQKPLPAHVHGAGLVTIVVEKKGLSFHLDTPSESILGFEHSPQSPADKKKVEEAMKLFKADPSPLVTLPGELGCKIESTSVDPFESDAPGHADFNAEIKWACRQSPEKASLKISLRKHFPSLKKLKIEILGDDGAKSVDVSTPEVQISL